MQIRNRSRKRNQILGAALLVLSLPAGVFSLWPTFYRTEVFSISSSLLPQGYTMEVRYPALGPAGEKVQVDVNWRPEGQSADPASPGEPNPVLVAQIQSTMVDFSPAGQISTPLQEGKPIHFSWEARSLSAGEGQFNLFFFRAGAEQVEGVYLQQPVWARSFPYRTFDGAGRMKFPFLFLSVFGALFGLGLLLRNTLR